MAQFGVNLERIGRLKNGAAILKEMHRLLTDRNAMAMVNARIRQEKIAQFYRENPPLWRDGIGPLTLAIDPYWRSYFAMLHESGEVWDEKDFQKWAAKNMPELAVKAVSPKIMVGYRGARGKVVKRYGERLKAKG